MLTRNAVRIAARNAIQAIRKDPELYLEHYMTIAEVFLYDEIRQYKIDSFRSSIDKKDNIYRTVIKTITELDIRCLKKMVENLFINSFWSQGNLDNGKSGNKGKGIPFAIVFGTPVRKYNSSFNETRILPDFNTINDIITQGKELGTFFYIFCGEELTFFRKDLLRLADIHTDCYFLAEADLSQIDWEYISGLKEIGNIMLAFRADKIDGIIGQNNELSNKLKLVKKNSLPFGYTANLTGPNGNIALRDDFIDGMTDCGAIFGFYGDPNSSGPEERNNNLYDKKQADFDRKRMELLKKQKNIFLLKYPEDNKFLNGRLGAGPDYIRISADGIIQSPKNMAGVSLANVELNKILEEPSQTPVR